MKPAQQRLLVAGALLAAIALPLVVPNNYVMGVIARICLYSLLALGLNIVVGFAGLLDIGYVAFFGIGSYTYAFLASPHFGLHVPFVAALLVVALVTAFSGLLIGAPTLRLRGDYLAIVTLGFGEIVYVLLINLDRPVNITGGPSGIISIDPPVPPRLHRQHQRPLLLSLPRPSRWPSSWPPPACATPGWAGPGRRSARTSSPPRPWA